MIPYVLEGAQSSLLQRPVTCINVRLSATLSPHSPAWTTHGALPTSGTRTRGLQQHGSRSAPTPVDLDDGSTAARARIPYT